MEVVLSVSGKLAIQSPQRSAGKAELGRRAIPLAQVIESPAGHGCDSAYGQSILPLCAESTYKRHIGERKRPFADLWVRAFARGDIVLVSHCHGVFLCLGILYFLERCSS
jgi:hypothetical protein